MDVSQIAETIKAIQIDVDIFKAEIAFEKRRAVAN